MKSIENGMPGSLSFYHASFQEFLTNEKRSTQRFCVNRNDVIDRLDHLCIEALCIASNGTIARKCRQLYSHLVHSRLTCFFVSKVDVLSWPGARNSDICFTTFMYLVYHTTRRDGHLRTESLQQLSRVNWNIVGHSDIDSGWLVVRIEALVRKIPEDWRPQTICPFKPSLLSILRQKGFKTKLTSLVQARKRKQYVMGTGSNRALLVEDQTWKDHGHDFVHLRTYPDAAEFK
ncbi:hypothetical protein P691DRAFT_106607 [Macrolepiota fuliginosa MF-IS2]|uniref:Uncharacterized protein n=1 Tax=Macrolepiota fuliginosa MF-IS2 TaxID=1400762 RepID=A0A9P5WZC4_9AGAR|nr:hypothetical protein P691DRAFT_106607 [Macrolepiota fuliginosa MF-IS2]